MRKKNRRMTKRHSVVAATTVRVGAVVVLFFVMVIFNMISSSRCTQLVAEKRKMERELAQLEDARMRESSRWEEMKTPDKIEAALVRHGLRMSLPRFDQTIRIRRDGSIPQGQIAVARARNQGAKSVVASAKPRVAAQRTVSYRRKR